MIIGFKDGARLFGIAVVTCCAVFVSTIFTNFYLDVVPLRETLSTQEQLALYDAQLAMAKFIPLISGGVLSIVAAIMLIFYIKIFIDSEAKNLGILKAMGMSDLSIAFHFWTFGLSVAAGALVGFALSFTAMPLVYEGLAIEGVPEIKINFHWELPVYFVIVPSILFTLFSCGAATFALRVPVCEMLKGKSEQTVKYRARQGKARSFPVEMCLSTLGSKKSLVFFVAFSGFCFSAMVQMSLSMNELGSGTMSVMILVIGLILALATLIMAVTVLINGNIKNISLMKTFGYSLRECILTVFGGFVPFAFIGFGVGSVYQYALLSIMVNTFFKDVGNVPDYSFSVPAFFIALFGFIVTFATVFTIYTYKMNRISVKEVMIEY